MPGLEIGAAVSGQLEFRDEQDLAQEVCVQEGVLPSALAPILPVLFVPNGRLLGALQSLISGVYKGPFASLQTFFAVHTTAPRAASGWRTTGFSSAGRGPATSPSTAVSTSS